MGSIPTVDLLFDWFGITCLRTNNFGFYLPNRLIQTSQTGGEQYSDTSPFSVPWLSALSLSAWIPMSLETPTKRAGLAQLTSSFR